MADRIQDLGIFTAYGEAREAGYEGTKAEFEEGLKKAAEAYDEAEAAAAAAAQSATAAAASAVDASTAVAEADSSADAAQASEAAADISAGAAASSAIDAGESADAASAAQTGAETAQVAAELAQTAAEAAATAADGSKTAAAGSASAAASSATAAAGSATAAAGSATAAASSATSASGSATAAAGSATAAAGSAEDAAESAAEAAATLESYAHVDGTYEEMTVGNAEQLVSKVGVIDKVPYTYRTSGGEIDIGDREIVERIVGGTIAWNQQVENGNFSSGTTAWRGESASLSVSNGILTVVKNENASSGVGYAKQSVGLIVGHKYLFNCEYKGIAGKKLSVFTNSRESGMMEEIMPEDANWHTVSKIVSVTSIPTVTCILWLNYITTTGDNVAQFRNVFYIDLSQTFGSTIADWLYSLEQTTAGAGVAWFRKLFPKDYYEYNSGELLSVSGVSSHELTGFNQWDEEWELGSLNTQTGMDVVDTGCFRSKNYIPIFPNTNYFFKGTSVRVVFYDANKNFIESPLSFTNQAYITPSNARYCRFYKRVSPTVYNYDICINIAWDGERNGEYEPYIKRSYPFDDSLILRGIPKLDANNSLYYDGDIYESDGAVQRRYGIVDLGTLDWTAAATGTTGYSRFSAMPPAPALSTPADTLSNVMCIKYNAVTGNDLYLRHDGISLTATGRIMVYDSAYAEGTAAAFKTAMSGVYLVYELVTPTTEEAEPYHNPQMVDDWGTEEYVDAGTRDVAIPVGHETFYQQNLRAKLEAAPNSPDANGDYIMRQTNGANAYVPLVIPQELPTMPTSDGTYSLQVTISGGTPTLAWVQNQ